MEISVNIKPDEDGYTGRECPECEKYFKIKFGTGLPEATDCHCPYCNHTGPQDEFWTKEQIEYANSVALNKISGELLKSLKKIEIQPKRNQFISIGIKVKGKPTPITCYSEKELEETIECEKCTLEYTIYGSFGYCPDCGIHNSIQIVITNFDLSMKILDLASDTEKEIKSKLVENALEDCVSAFDGYAREQYSEIQDKVSFQNIEAARNKILTDHGIDLAKRLDQKQWIFIIEQFQKRHLLAHKMGIIDAEYIKKTNCNPSLLKHKVFISESDVHELINCLKIVAENLFHGVPRN